MLTKIQKIISGVFLCLVFLTFVPTTIFAEVNFDSNTTSIESYNGWKTGGVKKYNAVVALPSGYGYLPNQQVGLATMNPGAGVPIDSTRYDALVVAAKEGKVLTNTWLNPATGQQYEKDKIYTTSSNEGVSYYYKPTGGTDAENNANTVLLAHATGKDIYFPNRGKDAAGNDINYITKASGDANSTDIGTERGLMNAIDVENGRAPGTSYAKISGVDTYKQDQETLPGDEAELARLKAQLAYDDDARNSDRGDALSTEDRAALEQKIADKQAVVDQKRINVENGKAGTAANTISMAACPSSFTDITFAKIPSCVITLLAIVANMVLKLSALLLYIVGNLFDYSIEIAVNSAEFIKVLGIVDPMWAVVRDFLNMTFIFVLIYVAWQIMLGKGKYTVKDTVVRLVLVAILINFSLFAAKIMVDASNVLSLNIYESIKQPDSADPSGRGSVSARIMSSLGLASIYKFSAVFDGKTVAGCGDVPGVILTVGVFGTILMLITAMAFLLAAILFFIRMLNILFLFITSPLWVWGYVIQHPKIQKHKDWWQNRMWGVLQFPVIYMLFLYVGLAMLTQLSLSQLRTSGGQPVSIINIICDTAAQQGESDVMTQLPVVINFVLVIAILMGALKYSVTDGARGNLIGGKLTSNLSNKFNEFPKRFAVGAAKGLYEKSKSAAAFATRNTIALAKGATVTPLRYAARQTGYKIAESFSNNMAERAVTAKSPKMRTAFAMLSQRYKDPAIFGEKKEEGFKRRTENATKRAEVLNKVQESQTKVESEATWKKKNPTGTAADYEAYLGKKINLIEDVYLGKLKLATGEGGKRNSDFLREAIEDVKDDKGNVIGKKLNQDALFRNITVARAFHEKDGSLLDAEKESRVGWWKTERSKARIKEKDKALRNRRLGKEKSVEDMLEEIEKDKLLLNWLPKDLGDVDPAQKKSYPSMIQNYIDEVEIIEKRRTNLLAKARSASDIDKINNDIREELLKIKSSTEDKVRNEKEKIDNKIAAKIDKIRKKEEEAKKK